MPSLSNEVRFESLLVSLSRTQQRGMPWMGFELATIRLLFCAKKQLNYIIFAVGNDLQKLFQKIAFLLFLHEFGFFFIQLFLKCYYDAYRSVLAVSVTPNSLEKLILKIFG